MLLFLEERKHNWKAHTVQLKRACLRSLLSTIGDLRMDQISRSDLAHFKDVVQLLPVRWEHMYPGVPIAEVITKEHSGPRLRPGTVNGYLAMAHGFFEWAYVHGYITSNPARKLKISLKGRVRDQRSRLYAGDLRLIFEESLYFSRTSAPAALAERKVDSKMYHLFWIPLVALYSGMRASEIVGLERQDICREDGVWCFRVRPNGLRDVKSFCSNRSVPIHPSLLKMGFLDSITHQAFGPRQNIWPNLSKHSGSYGGGLSRIWSQYKKNSGIDDVRKTFHSFRHTFIHALADVDSQVDVVAEIAGHSMKSEFYGRYRKRPDLKRLLKTVRRVAFPCQIDHLYT
jgi:integrase